MQVENMSEKFKSQLQQMTNEELIDFALEHVGEEHDSIRKAALQEHYLRIKNDPNTVTAPPGNIEILKSYLSRLQNK
ncbi:hypothetical protein Chro_0291 [Chroococcidiopsis thermalis PCC 7203]|uniref:Uncharacterized protein n=2 Tax=Chroococcidiopsis thermalis TaxID=54299 RepID=K9TUK9_CHRTP|nr:hypothetical protein Chro_0291 [Chroococcidiopsis thermalis PCC 7203]